MLRQSQAVFEDTEDTALLGRVFQLRRVQDEERAALAEALNRADAGERPLALLEGLEDWSAAILLAFTGMREEQEPQAASPARPRQGDTQPPLPGRPGRRSRSGRRDRTNREALLDAIRARVTKTASSGKSRPVTGRRADAEIDNLIMLAQDAAGKIVPDVKILHAIGWLTGSGP